jgi:hypothetical protein
MKNKSSDVPVKPVLKIWAWGIQLNHNQTGPR